MIKNLLSKISHFLTKYLYGKVLAIFLLSFLFFCFVIQPADTFPDPDSFYHAKMAEMTLNSGIVKNFPWLQFTGLKDYFTDQHFFYHLLLVPFAKVFGALAGTKIASIFFASLVIAVFYWFLKKFNISGAIFYTLLLFSSHSFLLRVNLAKAGALAIIILIFALYALFKNKPFLLFALGLIYVWTHGSWPVIAGLALIYVLVNLSFLKLFATRYSSLDIAAHRGERSNTKWPKVLKILIMILTGTTTGLVLNPYFPENLIFYWVQTVQIGFINYQDKIRVGAEWYPPSFSEFFSGASLVFVLLFISIAAFMFLAFESKEVKVLKKDMARIFTLLIISSVFFILTIKSVRNIEYFIPLSIISSAFLFDFAVRNSANLKNDIKSFFAKRKIIGLIIALYFLAATPYIYFININSARGIFVKGHDFSSFKEAAEIIKEKSSNKDVVFHSGWDKFPMLFYWNDKNYYIVGLDPTFFYLYNKETYKKWAEITDGKQKTMLWDIITKEFGAPFVFVDNTHSNFERNLIDNGKFIKIYDGRDARVYKAE